MHVARLEADVSGLNRGNLNICERLLARDNQCRGGLAACSTLVASQKAAVGRPGWTCNWDSFSSFSSYSFSFLILILLQVCLEEGAKSQAGSSETATKNVFKTQSSLFSFRFAQLII